MGAMVVEGTAVGVSRWRGGEGVDAAAGDQVPPPQPPSPPTPTLKAARLGVAVPPVIPPPPPSPPSDVCEGASGEGEAVGEGDRVALLPRLREGVAVFAAGVGVAVPPPPAARWREEAVTDPLPLGEVERVGPPWMMVGVLTEEGV